MRITSMLCSSAGPALRLAGKKCLITGGSQGIGLSIAQKFAQEGASVILLSRKESVLKQAVALLPNVTETQKHSIATFDVSKRKQFTDADIGTVCTLLGFI